MSKIGLEDDADITFAEWSTEQDQRWLRNIDSLMYFRIRAAFIRAYLEGRKDGGR